MLRLVTDTVLLCIARLQGAFASERGQTLAEYGLIITIIAVGTTVLGMIVFRDALVAGFNSASGCLDGSC